MMTKNKKLLTFSIFLVSTCTITNGASASSALKEHDVKSIDVVQKMIADKTNNLKNITPPSVNEEFIKYNENKILQIIGGVKDQNDKKESIKTINSKKNEKNEKNKKALNINNKNKSNNNSNDKNRKVKLKSKNSVLIDGEYYITTNENKRVTQDKRVSKTVYVNGVNVKDTNSNYNSTNVNGSEQKSNAADFFTGKSDAWRCKVNSGDPQLKDWVSKIRSRILAQFNGVNNIGGYRAGDPQDHGTGNALDVMVPVSSKLGDDIANWAIVNSQYLNIKYIIWKQHIWLPNDPTVWRGMNDRGSITQNHYDHVHLSFNDGDGVCPTN